MHQHLGRSFGQQGELVRLGGAAGALAWLAGHALQGALDLGQDGVEVEIALDDGAGTPAERLQVDDPIENAGEHLGEGGGRPLRFEAMDAVNEPFGDAATPRQHGHAAAGARFERGDAERFARPGREGENVVFAEEPGQLSMAARPLERDVIANAQSGGKRLEGGVGPTCRSV